MHRFLLHNDEIRETGDAVLSPGQVGIMNGWGIFSTIRVQGGVLFAWERHWARMKKDAARMRVPFPENAQWLEQRLYRLIEKNQAGNATLRVVIVRNRGGMWEGPSQGAFDTIALTAPLNDWGDAVKLSLIPHGRHAASEFAGTKYNSWSENLTRYERAHERGFDEVVLLNERGEVAECTSANIFAVKGDRVSTPPLSSGCLPGVTRALLLEEVRVPGISVAEQVLFPADLEDADEIFITSTTRDLMPAAAVEGLKVRQGRRVRDLLQDAFSAYTKHYVATRVREVEKVR
ncbi:MAG TPA: aminotransferase class IV [Bryobacteraceae bacterium]|jgi:branched-chain amino acid aminotransferase|nr:aminotransferase class IV [Bryobacteraceae bacterium]